MAVDNILQNEILTDFVYPFLLVFFIVFAILEKTKIFGDDKKQVNAFTAGVVGLIFVSAVSPKLIVNNLVLFLGVAIVVVFIGLLLWGFVSGGEAKMENKGVKTVAAIVIVLAIVIALFSITGIFEDVIDTLFKSSWSEEVWSNIIFLVIIAAAIAAVLATGKSGGK